MTDREDALRVSKTIAQELLEEGATAVYLTGSWARGDAHRESDLDIRVIGSKDDDSVYRRDGFLVARKWGSKESQRDALEDPAEVGSVVPGWKSAIILEDPDGVAEGLKREAGSWSWSRVEDKCDDWVAQEFVGYSEEIHTLYSNLDQGNETAAAVTRSTLSVKLPAILSVHLRILYETEKEMWDLVAEEMGEPYRSIQARALGENDEGFAETCRAVFELYEVASRKVMPILSDGDRDVVEHACGLAQKGPDLLG